MSLQNYAIHFGQLRKKGAMRELKFVEQLDLVCVYDQEYIVFYMNVENQRGQCYGIRLDQEDFITLMKDMTSINSVVERHGKLYGDPNPKVICMDNDYYTTYIPKMKEQFEKNGPAVDLKLEKELLELYPQFNSNPSQPVEKKSGGFKLFRKKRKE